MKVSLLVAQKFGLGDTTKIVRRIRMIQYVVVQTRKLQIDCNEQKTTDWLKDITFDVPHTSLPTSFLSSSSPGPLNRVLRLSTSFLKLSSSSFSVRATISSRIGRELCIASWIADVVVDVGFVGFGGGNVDSTG